MISEVKQKEKERKCLEIKVTTQKKELQTAKQEIKTLGEHQSVLQSTIDQQSNTISSQKLVIHEQEIALDSHFNLATSFMEEIEDRENNDEEDETSLDCSIDEMIQSKKSTSKLREVLIEQRRKINSLEDEIDLKCKEFKEKENSLLSDSAAAKSEMIEAHKETYCLKTALNELEEKIAKTEAENRQIQTNLASKTSSVEHLKSVNIVLKDKVDKLEEEVNVLRTEAKEALDNDLVKQLKKQLEEKEKDVQSINDYCDGIVAENNELKKEKVKNISENRLLADEMEQLKTQKGASDEENNKCQTERRSFEEQIEKHEKLKGAQDREIKKLCKEIDDWERRRE